MQENVKVKHAEHECFQRAKDDVKVKCAERERIQRAQEDVKLKSSARETIQRCEPSVKRKRTERNMLQKGSRAKTMEEIIRSKPKSKQFGETEKEGFSKTILLYSYCFRSEIRKVVV